MGIRLQLHWPRLDASRGLGSFYIYKVPQFRVTAMNESGKFTSVQVGGQNVRFSEIAETHIHKLLIDRSIYNIN